MTAKHRARLLATFLHAAFRALAIVGVSAAAAGAMQRPTPSTETLASEPAIRSALDFIRVNEPEVLNEQTRLCEIAAPPFAERLRAEAYRAAFERLGLKNVRIDAVGNVIGERPGRAAGPRVVMSAHLDTVFPEGTNVKTTRSGSTIAGPGISDDCRGLAVVLGVIRALNEARIETAGSVTFVGTVGEEGLGDLRGVKHLVGTELQGPHRSLRVDRRRRAFDHAYRRRKPPIPRRLQRTRRPQLWGFRNRQSRARPRTRDCQDCHPGSASRSEDDLQRRADRRRHVGQLDRGRGVDGDRHAVLGQSVADRRRQARDGGPGSGACRGECALGQQGSPDAREEAGWRSAAGIDGGERAQSSGRRWTSRVLWVWTHRSKRARLTPTSR